MINTHMKCSNELFLYSLFIWRLLRSMDFSPLERLLGDSFINKSMVLSRTPDDGPLFGM